VGKAGLGKSGRVIEKLQHQNDELRRDLNYEKARRREAEDAQNSAKSNLDSLRGMNESLVQQQKNDASVLNRRDRMIEDLKAELETEKRRRLEAEKGLKVVQGESESEIASLKTVAREEGERARKNEAQYEMLSRSWKDLHAGLETQIKTARTDLRRLHDLRSGDIETLKQLNKLVAQRDASVNRMDTTVKTLETTFKMYREEKESAAEAMGEKARGNEEENERLQREVKDVIGEMRRVMAVHNAFEETKSMKEAKEAKVLSDRRQGPAKLSEKERREKAASTPA
jgi:chromosome segregation ATPase